jgi:hypothetical protein
VTYGIGTRERQTMNGSPASRLTWELRVIYRNRTGVIQNVREDLEFRLIPLNCFRGISHINEGLKRTTFQLSSESGLMNLIKFKFHILRVD